ncbi:Fur family transcriptional regulator [Chloroflexota bacterium]
MSCVVTFKRKGMKLTPQRRLILDIIHDSKGHITADEILNYVEARVSGVNKSTIYRTLELLEELGCVFKSKLGDRFVYHHAEEGHHNHLVCRACGKNIDCDEDIFLPVKLELNDKYGFQAEFKHIVMNGLCNNCKGKG